MREVATALGMSHQRVHQIIGEDGILEVEATATEVTTLPTPQPTRQPTPGTTSTPTAPADDGAQAAAPGHEVVPAPGSGLAVTQGQDACSFCGAPRRELDRLLAAPGPVFICSGCVAQADAVATEAMAATVARGDVSPDAGGGRAAMRAVPVGAGHTCSFCRNAASVAGVMAEAGAGAPRICRRCIDTCLRLTRADEPNKTTMRRAPKIRCSFCNVSATETQKVIAGPRVYICGDCVHAASTVLASGESARGPRQVVLHDALTETHACAFCAKVPAQVAGMVRGGRGRICDECLNLCDDILAES